MFFQPKAVTLIEMIIALAIIAIVAFAITMSGGLASSQRLDCETRMLAADLRWARAMAVSKHNNYIIDFDLANEIYMVYENSVNPANLLKRQSLQVDIVSLSPAPNRITFNFPSGNSQAKQIDLSYRAKTGRITIFGQTGYVKIQ